VRRSGIKPDGLQASSLGRIGSTIFLLFFGGFALLFMGFVFFITWESTKSHFWTETPCEIISAEVIRNTDSKRNSPYELKVSYSYQFGGSKHESEDISNSSKRFDDLAEAQGIADEIGDAKLCYVDPSYPEKAVLKKGSLLPALFILFPLPFIAIAIWGIRSVWKTKLSGENAPPLTAKAKAGGGCVLIGFGSIFLLAGLGFTGIFIKPGFQILQARDWKAVPCKIELSEVRSHRGSKSTTYSVAMEYSYEFNGESYRASRYQFMGGSSRRSKGKRAIVRNHPPGKETTCYVDADNPRRAVINRDLTSDMAFSFIPLIFVAVGGGIIFFGIRTARKSDQTNALTSPLKRPRDNLVSRGTSPAPTVGSQGPTDLKPESSRIGKLILVLCMGVFWNGIVSVFVVDVVKGWKGGHGSWFETIFMIPFALIGIGFVIGFFYCVLGLFNPKPRLRLSRSQLQPGETADLDWSIQGRITKLNSFEIILEGIEEASYRRGTRTVTDNHTFATIPILKQNNTPRINSGRASIEVPENSMHSFRSHSNRIHWRIHVIGEISKWPDLDDQFPVEMLPQAVTLNS
jgi:hypothetical protein